MTSSGVELRPTVQVRMHFSQEDAVAKVSQARQSYILQLFGRYKNDVRLGTGALTFAINSAARPFGSPLDGWPSDEILERLLVREDTQTINEKEFLRLMQLRGALVSLAYTYLDKTALPDEIKGRFKIEKKNAQITQYAFDGTRDWFKNNPDMNVPVNLDPVLADAVVRVCRRTKVLVDFYNDERPITHLSAYKGAFGEFDDRQLPYHSDTSRAWALRDMHELFGSIDHLKEYDQEIGFTNDNFQLASWYYPKPVVD